MSVEVKTTEDVILTSTEDVIVELKSPEDIQTLPEIKVEAAVKKWTILGDDIYVANRTEDIPLWYQSVLDSYISNSSTLGGDLSALTSRFDNFEVGYTQEITTINNNHSTLVANVETNYVQNATYSAGIQNLELTKVTASEATAIANTTIGAWQIDPLGGGAWFDSKISTYSNDIQSQASSISSLSVQYNGLNVRIDETDSVLATTTGWAAESSKLITGPLGSITGWQFSDGSYTSSDFTIFADNFRITNGTNTANVPFSVIAGTPNKIQFDGVVDFTNTNAEAGYPGTTSINGGLIQTDTAWIGGEVKSTDFTTIGGPGFRLKSNALATTADPNIYGAYIKGGIIEAPVILGQNLIDVKIARHTNLLTGNGSFNIETLTFTLYSNKRVIINVDSLYYMHINDNTEHPYSDQFHAELVVDGIIEYSSLPLRSTLSVSNLFYGYNYKPGVLPYTHTHVVELTGSPAGISHTIVWRAVEDSSVGDDLYFDYHFRSITATLIDIEV